MDVTPRQMVNNRNKKEIDTPFQKCTRFSGCTDSDKLEAN